MQQQPSSPGLQRHPPGPADGLGSDPASADGVAVVQVIDRGIDAGDPVLVLLPAMGVASRFYWPLAEALASRARATVCCVELPGQGLSPLRAGHDDFGYADVVDAALPRIVSALHRRHPSRPVYLIGHSLGGQLAVLATERIGAELAGVILLAAGTAHHRAWPPALRLRARLTVHAIALVAWLLPWYPGHRLGFGGRQARRWMRDWSHNALKGGYRLHGPGRSGFRQPTLAEVDIPLLAIGIDGDAVAPREAQRALLSLLPRARIEERTLHGRGQDSPWMRHFSWARQPDEVVAACCAWLAGRAGSGPAR
ncbi:alpha/beta fold hydrolase [Rubrivivax sp. RP6-9]|uniref:alpha/beta fold hydrolase n=1 Tax=Rubrivivax sp. RP6-9 TaxID=3415750 RepID=UPI003CC518F7